MEVKILRLNTGEDIIASVNLTYDGTKTYQNPLKIAYTSSSRNPMYMSVGLIQWVFPGITETNSYHIAERDILFETPPSSKMEIYYHETVNEFEERLGDGKAALKVFEESTGEELDEDDLDELSDILDQMSQAKDKSKLH